MAEAELVKNFNLKMSFVRPRDGMSFCVQCGSETDLVAIPHVTTYVRDGEKTKHEAHWACVPCAVTQAAVTFDTWARDTKALAAVL